MALIKRKRDAHAETPAAAPATAPNLNCNRCPMKCGIKIDLHTKKEIFQRFHSMKTKHEQDIYIQCLIEVQNIKQRRKRNLEGKERSRSYGYFVNLCNKKIKVCQFTFAKLHGVSIERLKIIKKLLLNNETPSNKRGKYPKGNAITADIMNLVKSHSSLYPVKQAHYSGADYQYLDAKLNVKIMHEMFCAKYPDLKVT
ncbi:hypothetical protein MML48_1g05213 [Holotrichia oblita]|uniref:Uncharacterized protein n=1 Tax=Holotrichia oblita TaxID=644536 RepID=A0ACB9TTC0_HOLOL|nr:hypothetical protein MML48_1g05213 [Holotrichia oblita]